MTIVYWWKSFSSGYQCAINGTNLGYSYSLEICPIQRRAVWSYLDDLRYLLLGHLHFIWIEWTYIRYLTNNNRIYPPVVQRSNGQGLPVRVIWNAFQSMRNSLKSTLKPPDIHSKPWFGREKVAQKSQKRTQMSQRCRRRRWPSRCP